MKETSPMQIVLNCSKVVDNVNIRNNATKLQRSQYKTLHAARLMRQIYDAPFLINKVTYKLKQHKTRTLLF